MRNLIVGMNTLILTVLLMSSFTSEEKFVYKELAKHIVKLASATGTGTGFYLKYRNRNFLVTNMHVCGDDIGLNINNNYRKIAMISDEHDLCILESDRKDGLRLARKELEQFDKVHVVGHPMGNDLTSRDGRFVIEKYGIFSWVKPYPIPYIHISVTAFGGNSGSPVMNEDGRVIGVLFSGDPRTNEDAHLVPTRVLKRFLDKQLRK